METNNENGGVMKKIICPICGAEAKKTQTKYGIRNHCCSLWSWGESPLADKKTHKARIKAHEYFDILWKSKLLTRTQAYAWLAKSLGISKDECHMKKMNHQTAKKVIRLCRNFAKTLNISY